MGKVSPLLQLCKTPSDVFDCPFLQCFSNSRVLPMDSFLDCALIEYICIKKKGKENVFIFQKSII